MDTRAIKTFLKEKVGAFHDLSTERLQLLVEGLRVGSFAANEAVAHLGAEATHFGVVLSGDQQLALRPWTSGGKETKEHSTKTKKLNL